MDNESSKTSKMAKETKALTKPAEFNQFVQWISVPEHLRELKTQGDFSKKYNVSEKTLSEWKQRDDFWRAVEIEWRKWGRVKTSNVIARFYATTMKEGKTSDIKLWLQYFLDWSEKIDSKVNHSGALEIIHTYRKSKDDPTSKPTSNPQVESKDDKTD